MRVATWNVNSLNARMDRVLGWLDHAQPDILLMQETKLADDDAPAMPFQMRGYQLVHHGEGRWNGVAIASRKPFDAHSVITNFGDGPVRNSGSGVDRNFSEEDFNPFDEARMLSVVIDGTRYACIYAPNGRVVGSPFYAGKLAWYDRLSSWLAEATAAGQQLIVGGDFNIAPTSDDVWNEKAVHGGTHVSPPEREAFAELLTHGLVDSYRSKRPEPARFTWWDYRQGHFHKNMGMRIDHLLVSRSLAEHVVWAEIDREARKGVPIPSDHAPLFIDIDQPGVPIDAGWEGALERIASRTRPTTRAKSP